MNTLVRSVLIASCALAGLLLPAGATAAAGDADPTFGSFGVVTTPIGSSHEGAEAAFLQPDGKIVAAGGSSNGTNDDFALVRYNANGSLDTSFDSDGKMTTPIGPGHDRVRGAVLQPDGKIVAAGYSSNGTDDDFALSRYNATGSLDTSFGTGGKVTTPIGSLGDRASAVALQTNGKIVAAGFVNIGPSDTDVAVVRYNANGSLDTTFGSGGKVTTPIGSSFDHAEAIVVQPDGKIVVAGDGDDAFALVRYNANGSLDSTFGSGGKMTTPIGSSGGAHAVALQPDGKIVAAGEAVNGSTFDFALARYTSSGFLDATFGSGGKVMTDLDVSDRIFAIALQPDGKIVAAGESAPDGGIDDFALARYTTKGSLDGSFGTGGKAITSINQSESAQAVALQPDGRIVAVGGSTRSGSNSDFALVRYLGSNPRLSVNDISLNEGNAGTLNATFTVSLDMPSGATQASVQYNTADGTALNADDYLRRSGVVTFSGSQTSQTVTVPVVGDTFKEPTERFFLNLSSPVGASILDAQGVARIGNDDQTTITLTPSAGPPTSSFSVSGIGFTPGEWVDLYFNTSHTKIVVADEKGKFAATTLTVPPSALPGAHWITAKGEASHYSAQSAFTVRTDWAQFHWSPSRQGFNAVENLLSAANVADLDLSWRTGLSAPVDSSPAVAGGAVYTSAFGNLRALDAQTGVSKFAPFAVGTSSSSPAVGGGAAFVAGGGKLFAVTPTGTQRFATSTITTSNSTSPAFTANAVYVGGTAALYSVNPTTGATIWTGNTDGSAVDTAPAVAGARVFAAAANGNLYAFPTNCTTACNPSGTVAVDATSSPTVVGGVVYVGSSDLKLHALSASCFDSGGTGCELWSSGATGGAVSSTPAVAGGRVYVGSDDGNVYAFPTSCTTPCAPLWSQATGGAVVSSPAVAGGIVYLGSSSKFLYALKATDGSILWSYPTGGAVGSSPAVADGRVYAGSADSRLYAFALPSPPALAQPDPGRLVANPFLRP